MVRSMVQLLVRGFRLIYELDKSDTGDEVVYPNDTGTIVKLY